MTANTESLPLFLGSVIVLSASGVMMPGPVTAVTVTKGTQRKWPGALVAIGHGIIEIPLIILVYYGLAEYLKMSEVKIGVGLAGGLVLLWMAWGAFRTRITALEVKKDSPHSSIVAGLATTAASPYFFVWWATLGAALILNALALGLAVLIIMSVLHWSIDLGWNGFLGYAANRSRAFGSGKAYLAVFGLCAIIMLVFGIWFLISAVGTVLSL